MGEKGFSELAIVIKIYEGLIRKNPKTGNCNYCSIFNELIMAANKWSRFFAVK